MLDPDSLPATPMVVALDARLQGPGAAPAVVEADELAALQRELAVDAEQAVIACLRWARRWAFAPTSRFEVGAAAWGESGRVHLGANIEFSSLPLNETVHAEQSAIMQAWVHGERQLRALATSAAPCGYCRQFMLELPSPRPIAAAPPTREPSPASRCAWMTAAASSAAWPSLPPTTPASDPCKLR